MTRVEAPPGAGWGPTEAWIGHRGLCGDSHLLSQRGGGLRPPSSLLPPGRERHVHTHGSVSHRAGRAGPLVGPHSSASGPTAGHRIRCPPRGPHTPMLWGIQVAPVLTCTHVQTTLLVLDGTELCSTGVKLPPARTSILYSFSTDLINSLAASSPASLHVFWLQHRMPSVISRAFFQKMRTAGSCSSQG